MRTFERTGLRIVLGMAAGLLASCSTAEVIEPQAFSTPEEATRSLADAAGKGDTKALIRILGSEAEDVIHSGDPVDDANARERFLQLYRERNRVEAVSDSEAVLHVGPDDWPFPIPIVKDEGSGWVFDVAEGKEEIIDRRVGKNELDTMQTCLAIADAQREYYRMDPDRDGLHAYAGKILSTPGKKDGLYWETGEGEAESPLGPLVAVASSEGGGRRASGDPYHGYFYRLITAQGEDAPGGAYEYEVNGKLVGGFALIAWPAEYDSSGVMTFLTNHDGIVYQKDLGEDTHAEVEKITAFNPDRTWMKAEVAEPEK
jgi:hypothetical protein